MTSATRSAADAGDKRADQEGAERRRQDLHEEAEAGPDEAAPDQCSEEDERHDHQWLGQRAFDQRRAVQEGARGKAPGEEARRDAEVAECEADDGGDDDEQRQLAPTMPS